MSGTDQKGELKVKIARLAVIVGIGAMLLAWGVATSSSSIQQKKPLPTAKQLALAKAATAKYRNVQRAEADGYRAPAGPDGKPVCVASPAGGMGIHYENAALMANNALHVQRPEMLVYAPQADGSLKLVALEYFKADNDQSEATREDLPRAFRRAFDGPHEGHAPGMPVHYDLHVWLYQANRSGTFVAFNPAVSC
jgi:hypothetical protein